MRNYLSPETVAILFAVAVRRERCTLFPPKTELLLFLGVFFLKLKEKQLKDQEKSGKVLRTYMGIKNKKNQTKANTYIK